MNKDTITQLINDLSEDDLSESQKYIANEIGLDNFVSISLKTGGGTYCFPNRPNLFKNVIRRHVQEEFNGSNIKELATKYEICHATVYKILKEKSSK